MKTITIDFEQYQKELQDAEAKGYKRGAFSVERLMMEMFAKASEETLYDIASEDSSLIKIMDNVYPRFNSSK